MIKRKNKLKETMLQEYQKYTAGQGMSIQAIKSCPWSFLGLSL
jgi:hypothetical protein